MVLEVPEAGNPIEGLEFVHAYVVPTGPPLILIAVVLAPLQIVWFGIAFTTGTGSIVTCVVADAAAHPPAGAILLVTV
jgi:hypothetical protein